MRKRGFEIVSSYINNNVNLPKRATNKSAGYDFFAAEDIVIEPNAIKLVPTGIKAYMQEDEVLKLYIRSSMAVKKKLVLANQVGIIDADYYNNNNNEGHIFIAIKNEGNEIIKILKDERVAQGIFEKFLIIDEDNCATIRTGGFGSSGQ